VTTTYTRNFTQETYPPRGLGLIYYKKKSGVYPELGIDPTYGLYMYDNYGAQNIHVVWMFLHHRHRKQGYTASGRFRFNVSSVSDEAQFGFAVGALSDQTKMYVVYYSLKNHEIRVEERDFVNDTTNILASQGSYSAQNQTEYIFEVTVTYDEATGTITVDAALKDTAGTVLISLTGVSTAALPIFGIYLASGWSQTGYVYCKEVTVTYDGDPDTSLPELAGLLFPDLMIFDWVGCPNLVFWQSATGSWYPYNPDDGYTYVVVRLHGEESNTGDRIDMYKIVGDPRDPTNWQFVKTVFSRNQLGWELLEEFNLLVKNDGTYIAFAAGGSGLYAIYRLISTDGGATWTVDKKIFSEKDKNNSIWVEHNGIIYMAHGDDQNIYFHKSTDLGITWTLLGQVAGRKASICKVSEGKYYVAIGEVLSTDNANYFRMKTTLYETADFSALTKVRDLVVAVDDYPWTVYAMGFIYTCMVMYGVNIIMLGETGLQDRDVDDGFVDQRQRHLAALIDPVGEVAAERIIKITTVLKKRVS